MSKILIVGNPNVGKSTLFNSLTKSTEHTGNFHGVTVDKKSKKIKVNNEEFELVDLPGLYSLNTFSYEEEIAKKDIVLNTHSALVLVDANSIRKNLYLCLEMSELKLDYKILINNYKYFEKKKNKLKLEKLKLINPNIEIINAKKIEINENLFKFTKNQTNLPYLNKYLNKIREKFDLDDETIVKALNGIFDYLTDEEINFIKNLNEDLIADRYKFIDEILKNDLEQNKNFIYGLSPLDKFILNPIFLLIFTLGIFFLSVYTIFFLIGPILTDFLNLCLNKFFINPFLNVLYSTCENVWLIEFFKGGIFSSFSTILGFLPSICLMYIFLTVLEDSGLISRLAYALDDMFTSFGLNGKAVYIMLMGLGCNTMATMLSRNMTNKELKTKTAMLNPYVTCMARLPVLVVIASAFFGLYSYLVVAGLYLIGIIIMFVVALILNKTIMKTEDNYFLLEFPPLRGIDVKHVLIETKKNSIELVKRIFTIVLFVGVIVWITLHTTFKFQYTEKVDESILFSFANLISFIFAPIGLNNAGVVCALIVGVLAKELIISTFSIANNVTSTSLLVSSLTSTFSVVHFSFPSAVSFLVFSLLYCPCVSNLAVLKKETDTFTMWLCVVSQFTIAYMLSFFAFQSLSRGVSFAIISLIVIFLIIFSLVLTLKRIKSRKIKCLFCDKCSKKN